MLGGNWVAEVRPTLVVGWMAGTDWDRAWGIAWANSMAAMRHACAHGMAMPVLRKHSMLGGVRHAQYRAGILVQPLRDSGMPWILWLALALDGGLLSEQGSC